MICTLPAVVMNNIPPLLQGKQATCNTGFTISITGKPQEDQVTQKTRSIIGSRSVMIM